MESSDHLVVSDATGETSVETPVTITHPAPSPAPVSPLQESQTIPVKTVAPAPEPKSKPEPVYKPIPVRVDGTNRRSDHDALEGHFVEIETGDHKGKYASFEKVLEHGADGYPKRILVRLRDTSAQFIDVAYEDVKHALHYHGGR